MGARDGNETFTADQIRDECDDHVAKQRAGMFSTDMRADRDSGLSKLIWAKIENHPHSQEYKNAETQLNQVNEIKIKKTPGQRHEKRMLALYVEPISETSWNRPADTSEMAAYEFLVDAVNDYSGAYHQGYITSPIFQEDEPDLCRAIEQWADRPELPAPQHPRNPVLQQVDATPTDSQQPSAS
jgi:hypothetical protein